MALHIVAYDLNQQGQNYDCIIKKLEGFGTFWHFQKSVWLVEWAGSSYDLANDLEGCLDSNDTLFVSRVTSDSAWSGYDADGTAWIASHL